MANTKKLTKLSGINDFLSLNTNFALVKFERTTHISLEALRKQLKASEAKLKVVKNSLFEKSINKLSQTDNKFVTVSKKMFPLKESTAVLTFGKDWNKGLTAISNFIKKDQTIDFKFGYIDQEVYESSTLKRIAQLPSKEQLIAKVIGGMKSPMSHTVYALKFNLQKLVYVLDAKSKQS